MPNTVEHTVDNFRNMSMKSFEIYMAAWVCCFDHLLCDDNEDDKYYTMAINGGIVFG